MKIYRKTRDTILVHEGIYYEHISLNRSPLLLGENRCSSIIDGGGTPGDVVEIAQALQDSSYCCPSEYIIHLI